MSRLQQLNMYQQVTPMNALLFALEEARLKGTMTTTIEWFWTPELAVEIKERGDRNRNLGRWHVDQLARTISRDKWATIHQGFAIGPNGELGDGQHRNEAIIKAGKPVRVNVCQYHDLDNWQDAKMNFDRLRRRTAGHSLEFSGLVDKGEGAIVAEVINCITLVDSRFNKNPSADEMASVLEQYSVGLQAILEMNRKEYPASVRASFAIAFNRDAATATKIMELVKSKVGLQEGSGALSIVQNLQAGMFRPKNRAKTESGEVVKQALNLLYHQFRAYEREAEDAKVVKRPPRGRNAPGLGKNSHVRKSQEAMRYFLGVHAR